jgi:hypothetical protein
MHSSYRVEHGECHRFANARTTGIRKDVYLRRRHVGTPEIRRPGGIILSPLSSTVNGDEPTINTTVRMEAPVKLEAGSDPAKASANAP